MKGQKNFFNKSVGILGGGQLARMMALKGHELGLQVHVLSADANDPAAQVCNHWHKGNPNNSRSLASFLEKVDVATFESEFYDGELLDRVSKQARTRIFPQPLTMHKLQDRWDQKSLLVKYKLPTSRFVKIDCKNEGLAFLARQPAKAKTVLKQRRFGYDGYGTYVLKGPADLELPFAKTNANKKFGFIAEDFIPFKRELSLIAVRNLSGEVVFFPLVETLQKDSRCLWVNGPIKHDKCTPLKSKIKRLLKDIEYSGVIAFELFDTGKELLINEIAPRVHNSGHFSLDGLEEDQFSLHLKAILDAPLKSPKTRAAGFAMYNLLGSSTRAPRWNLPENVHLHWYGKSDNRPGRKMGHLNCTDSSPKRALQRLMKAAKEFQL